MSDMAQVARDFTKAKLIEEIRYIEGLTGKGEDVSVLFDKVLFVALAGSAFMLDATSDSAMVLKTTQRSQFDPGSIIEDSRIVNIDWPARYLFLKLGKAAILIVYWAYGKGTDFLLSPVHTEILEGIRKQHAMIGLTLDVISMEEIDPPLSSELTEYIRFRYRGCFVSVM